MGKLLLKIFNKKIKEMTRAEDSQDESMQRMIIAMVYDMPFRSFSMSGMSHPMIESIINLLNKKFIKGLLGLGKALRLDKVKQSNS